MEICLHCAVTGPKYHVHHSSFEVHDFDIQALGHQWLRDKNYDLVWGVGRHVMGSQIFDYWFDRSGFVLEHYGMSLFCSYLIYQG
jgi:hypothetical protein